MPARAAHPTVIGEQNRWVLARVSAGVSDRPLHLVQVVNHSTVLPFQVIGS
jgi:hypothetical protein